MKPNIKITGSLASTLEAFIAAQESLPPEMTKVLQEHLWDLYEGNTPKAGAGTTLNAGLIYRPALSPTFGKES